MNVERVARTIALLENIARSPQSRRRFDLNVWSCGTAACAVGHAAQDEWHVKQGLSLVPMAMFGGKHTPCYAGLYGFHAVTAFYDVDLFLANYWFGASHYPNARDPMLVADRMREYLKEETCGDAS